MPDRAHASPTKDFFISMITRDIALEDCILDLLDNSIDGARSAAAASNRENLDGYFARISLSAISFTIEDNCGGMSIDQATNYAFHFGRKRDAEPNAPHAIGLYGIGMKRAIFKIGKKITVKSSTALESFSVPIDVDDWAQRDADWDFELIPGPPETEPGTRIEILDVNEAVSEEFADTVFVDELRRIIGRDYSVILRDGFSVTVNGEDVRPFNFGWLVSEDFEPINLQYEDGGVQVELIAGATRIPEEQEPGDTELAETQYYGWFVVCNDRVVLAGNKDSDTVWGDEGFPGWHPQYNGFTGIVSFTSEDPKLLPWTTTKRSIDATAPVYRRAVAKMKEATRPYITYTNVRKSDLEEARRREQLAKPVSAPPSRSEMKVPQLSVAQTPRVKYAHIAYSVPESEYVEVAASLGDGRMPRKEVGLKTFQFYRYTVLGEE